MKVRLKFFASFRLLTGTAGTELEVPEGTTTSDLLEIIKAMYDGFNEKTVLYAVNGEYVGGTVGLKEGDAIAFFPPVSGG
jgi:molybdopterin synthase sulfur carrier subunit